jgi:hypothetical protein
MVNAHLDVTAMYQLDFWMTLPDFLLTLSVMKGQEKSMKSLCFLHDFQMIFLDIFLTLLVMKRS